MEKQFMFDHLIIPRNLAAIWLTKSIVKGDGTKSPRITKGDQVEIKENELVDCTSPTHEILECYGTTHDQFRTKVYRKNCLKVEFTYDKGELLTCDLTIHEINNMPISFNEIKQISELLGHWSK